MKMAQRMQQLAPYLFAQLEAKIAEAKKRGIDVINLGIGDPDQPTPPHIIARLQHEAAEADNHQYPSSAGMEAYRSSVSSWYHRYGVNLDPLTEIGCLIGSKEGIGHLPFCYIDPGDIALVPDPGYPVYQGGVTLAGGQPYFMPLQSENGFLPVLEDIPSEIAKKAKLLFLNYPNNPTGATATKAFFQDVVKFAKRYDIIAAHDAAYVEIGFENYEPLSFLQIPGAKDVGVEFGSVSKTHNMTGWRIGWIAGQADVVKALITLKSNLDSGAFQAVQYAAMTALDAPQDCLTDMLQLYKKRRDLVVDTLNSMGWQLEKPRASIYVWAPTPKGTESIAFAEQVFTATGVVLTPGVGYGPGGEGYFRISLTVPDDQLAEAMARLRAHFGADRS